MGKRTEEKNTSKVAPAGGGDCGAKLLEIGNFTRLKVLEILENKFHEIGEEKVF